MSMILGVILTLSVLGGMNFYVAKRLYQYIKFVSKKLNGIVFIVFYTLLTSALFISTMPLPIIVKNTARLISAYWVGIFIYLFIFFLLSDLFILLGKSLKLIPVQKLQNIRFYARTIAVLLTLGTVSYGIYNGKQLKTVSYDIQLNRSLSGEMNIVFISDLHLGDVNSERRLESIVQGINSLNPDIVCIIGDIFNDDFYTIRDPGRASKLLRSINATYGVFASLGNHDGGRTLPSMMDFLSRSNVKLLNCEHVIIDERLILIGRLDATPIGGFGDMKRRDFSEILARIEAELPIVVMEHNPRHIDEYDSEVDLILAGHTHRGQLFPGSLFTRAIFTVDYGHFQRDSGSPHVIVTQGAHTWLMPMRIGSNNEIASVIVR